MSAISVEELAAAVTLLIIHLANRVLVCGCEGVGVQVSSGVDWGGGINIPVSLLTRCVRVCVWVCRLSGGADWVQVEE